MVLSYDWKSIVTTENGSFYRLGSKVMISYLLPSIVVVPNKAIVKKPNLNI